MIIFRYHYDKNFDDKRVLSEEVRALMPVKANFETLSITAPKLPKMFMVTLHNDDYTTTDFVVMILMKVFRKSLADATAIMTAVHETGQCDVSAYTYDIAITKKMQVQQMADERGYPLKVTLREVSS